MQDCDNNRQNLFQSFETNQVLSCFWIWQAKILHGSRKVVVVFFCTFSEYKDERFKTVVFFGSAQCQGLLRHVFPPCSAVTVHSWNAPHDEKESWIIRRMSGEDPERCTDEGQEHQRQWDSDYDRRMR